MDDEVDNPNVSGQLRTHVEIKTLFRGRGKSQQRRIFSVFYPTQSKMTPCVGRWNTVCFSLIIEGLWEGQPSPNINGEERFLTGAHIEDVLYVEEDEVRMQLKSTSKFSIL